MTKISWILNISKASSILQDAKQYKNTHAHWPIGEKLQWLSELISYDNALSCHKWLEQGLEWEDKNII